MPPLAETVQDTATASRASSDRVGTVFAMLGLKLVHIGPELGDDVALKRFAKGASSTDHVEVASQASRFVVIDR